MSFLRRTLLEFIRVLGVGHEEGYARLPTTREQHLSPRTKCIVFTWKRVLVGVGAILFFFIGGILLSGIPPSFEDIWTYERGLPQNLLQNSPQQGQKYLRISNPAWGFGLNNILEESIIMSFIAYTSNRSYVFEDYVWSHAPLPYTIYDYALRPTRMPLNAFISGPTAGGPMLDYSPRAVNPRVWDAVCPHRKIHKLNTTDAPGKEADGLTIANWWKAQLESTAHECIMTEVPSNFLNRVLESGSERLLALWPSLSTSPILQQFAWSPLVLSALERNFMLFRPPSLRALYNNGPNSTLQGLVAVHLRRGDFDRHCKYLEAYGFEFMAFNSFPEMIDKFAPPSGKTDRIKYFMEHCLPDIGQVVSRLRSIRKDNPGLRRVYLLTNAWPRFLSGLLAELKKDGWDDLKSTCDLILDAQQYWVSNAVDMAIAEKAQVFIGNGFSSMTANIQMLRMAKGLHMSSNRLL